MNKPFVRTATSVPLNPLWPKGSVDANGKARKGRMSVKDMEAHSDQSILQGHRGRQEASKAAATQWLAQHPSSVENLVGLHDSLKPKHVQQGADWYPRTNYAAHILARDASANTGIPRTADQAIGHLANYSPQTNWYDNMHQASLALHAKDPKEVPGAGGAGWKSHHDGKGFMSSNAQSVASQQINAGHDWREVKGIGDQKVGNFGRNMSAGGLDPEGHDPASGSHVPLTIDRHMLSAAHGDFAGAQEYNLSGVASKPKVYDAYRGQLRDAQNVINQKNGTNYNGSQVQAQLWLGQQEKNELQNGGNGAGAARDRWNEYAKVYHPDLVDEVPGTGNKGAEGAVEPHLANVVATSHGMPTWQEQEPDFGAAHKQAMEAKKTAPAKVAAWVRTASRPKKNFVYDPIAEQYKTSKLDAKFSCNCGKTFAPTGFHRCACGQSWASFTIGSQDKTAAKAILVVRQVSEHRDRILAKKAEMISDPEDQQYNRANSSEQHPEREQTESFDNEYTEGVKPHEGDPFYVRKTESDPAPVVLDKEASLTPPFVRK